jgi:hypothetical protein
MFDNTVTVSTKEAANALAVASVMASKPGRQLVLPGDGEPLSAQRVMIWTGLVKQVVDCGAQGSIVWLVGGTSVPTSMLFDEVVRELGQA